MTTVITVAALLAAFSLIPACPCASDDSDALEAPGWMPDAPDWSGVAISIGGVLGLSFTLGYMFNDADGGGGGAGDSVVDYALDVQAAAAAHEVAVVANTSAMLLDGNARTLPLASSHIARAAEVSAATLWSPAGSFDASAVLEFGGIYSLLGDALHNTAAALRYGMSQSGDRVQAWSGSDYRDIAVGIEWEGRSVSNATDHASIIPTLIARATQSANLVYVPDLSPDRQIWAFQAGEMRPSDGGAPVALHAGSNILAPESLPAGWYSLTQGVYAGILMPAASPSSASVEGGAVIDVDGSLGYAVPDGGGLSVTHGTTVHSDHLRWTFSVPDGGVLRTAGATGAPDPVANMVLMWAKVVDAVEGLLYDASVAGQVMWTLVAGAGESNILLSPSSVSASLSGAGMDAAQSHAMYVSALCQISDYWSTYGTQLEAGRTRISEASLETYCFGDIHDANGDMIVENAVFTPYVYARSMAISTSGFNTMDQDGFVMVWATGADGLEGFDASDVDSHGVVLLPAGSFFTAEEISHQHEHADSVLLKVKEVGEIEVLSGVDLLLPPIPKVIPADGLVMAILVELAVILCLLAWAMRSPYPLIPALVVLVVAAFFTDWVTDLILGAFGR